MGRIYFGVFLALALSSLQVGQGFRKRRKKATIEGHKALSEGVPDCDKSGDDSVIRLETSDQDPQLSDPRDEVMRMQQAHADEADLDVLDQLAPADVDDNANDIFDYGIANTDKIKTGVELAEKISKFIADGDFSKTLTALAGISPWLGFIGPLISLFDSSESAELKYMKQQFKLVIDRLDSFLVEFGEVKRLIDWRNTQAKYSDAEQGVTALSAYLADYVGASKSSQSGYKNRFMLNYRSKYQAAAFTLYEGIVKNRALSGNLVKESMKYTQNHRQKVQRFMLSILQLVMNGAQAELSYYTMTESQDFVDDLQKDWQTRVTQIRDVMRNTDKDILDGWHDQMKTDVIQLMDKYPAGKESNKDFSSRLYNFLADKYSWRHWAVVVTKDVSGGNNHYHGWCGGHAEFRRGSRNVVVGSRLISQYKQHNSAAAESLLSTLARNARSRSDMNPEGLYNRLPSSAKTCSPYYLKSFICWGCDVWYVRAGGTCTTKKLEMSRRVGRSYVRNTVNSIICG